jgi:signal transduction histidine kinase
MFRRLSTTRVIVDAAIAVVFFAFVASFPAFAGEGVASVAVALGMAAALAVRRLSPALALGLAWLTALAQMAAGLSPQVSDIAVFAVLYVTAAYGSRLVFWLGFASSFVAAIAIAIYLVFVSSFLLGGGVDWRSLPLALLVMLSAAFAFLLAWTAGALVRTALRGRESRLARDAARAQALAEAERVRIARDMHDVVAHSLAVVVAQADGGRYAAASDPDAATAALGTIAATARAALADVRVLLTQLRHSQGDGPQPSLADLDALFGGVRAAGVELRVAIAPVAPPDAPAAVQLAVFRILQEALTNALRHGVGPVDVWLAWHPDRVRLAVRNPLGAAPAAASAGHGIVGMRERALLVGGHLNAVAVEGAFAVDAELPMGVPG